MTIEIALYSILPSLIGITFCTIRGSQKGRWAEGFFIGAALGILGVPVAYAFWQPQVVNLRIRKMPKNWSKWSGPEVSAGCVLMGLGIMTMRIFMEKPIPTLTQTQTNLVMSLLMWGGGICALVGIWNSDTRKAPVGPFCAKCDYSLYGNVSGLCPECGSDLTESPPVDATTQNPPRRTPD